MLKLFKKITSNTKFIVITAATVLAIVGVIILIIMTGGRSKTITKLFNALTDSYQKSVIVKELENDQLDAAWNSLTAQERALIRTIKEEPGLYVPEDIDKNDYKAILAWFDRLETHYE